MLSANDKLAFCVALQRMARFTPAELAINSGRRLRQAQEFLAASPRLVQVDMQRGTDPRRPMREYWVVADERIPLAREIDSLRAESRTLPVLGDLFNGIDRLLRDIAASESALEQFDAGAAARHLERGHLAAQRHGVEHALVDLEIGVAKAVRARRQSNHAQDDAAAGAARVAPAPAWTRGWFDTAGMALLDWSTAAERIVPADMALVQPVGEDGSEAQIADVLARLAATPGPDAAAIGRAVATLRGLRAGWPTPGEFEEALDVEFRHLLQQPFGRRLLSPLAVVAAALAATACARSLFEGWINAQGATAAPDDLRPIVPAVLARLSYETHLEGGSRWTANPAASMCQYILTRSIAPLATLLVAAGSLLAEATDLAQVMAKVAHARALARRELSTDQAHSINKTVWLALFVQAGRPTPVRSIPSIPELPQGEAFFDTRGAVVHRLERSHEDEDADDEYYELRPGRDIQQAVAQCSGESDVRLAMPVTPDFERRRTEAAATARWTPSPAPSLSFLGNVEAARRLS